MRTALRDVRVFDGERTTARADVLIDGDRIVEHDDRRADIEIDGSGRTLLPGLIDAHTHTFDGSLAQALSHGVTTELDMFCLPANLARQRRLADEHDDVADIRSSGMLATAPGGHPSQLMDGFDASAVEALGDATGSFDTVAEAGQAAAFVEARLAEGIDYLKIVIDDGALSGTDLPALTPDIVAALVDAAHAAGLWTIAHAVTARDTAVALDAGVDCLAHVWSDTGPDDSAAEDLAARVAAQGVAVVSTLAYFEVFAGEDTEPARDEPAGSRSPDRAKAAVDRNMTTRSSVNARHAARVLYRAGVPLLAGTDANPFAPLHGAALHREMELLTRAGLTNEEALAAATSVPARHFGLTDRGRIAPGLRADLLLVDGDPTRDITATRSIADVWRRGACRIR